MRRPSLRVLLTLPYGLLVLLGAGVALWQGQLNNQQAVDSLAEQVLQAGSERVVGEIEQLARASGEALDLLTPVREGSDPLGTPLLLRERLWHAAGQGGGASGDPSDKKSGYAYYGDQQGRFLGLMRLSNRTGELRVRDAGPSALRLSFELTVPLDAAQDRLQPAGSPERFDPRERPWYQQHLGPGARDRWSPVYIDFRSRELVMTRSRALRDAQGGLLGVLATDVSLRSLQSLLGTLQLGPRSVALLLEPDGALLAASRGETLLPGRDGELQRVSQAHAGDAVMQAAYRAARELPVNGLVQRVALPGGETLHLLQQRWRDERGLDWRVLVLMPRSEFSAAVDRSLRNSVFITVATAAALLGIGFLVLRLLQRELRGLSGAVARIARGEFSEPLHSDHPDELGALARDVGALQRRLHTDTLTGLANRASVMSWLERRVQPPRRRTDQFGFAVVFADLNGFKRINDTHGHDVGDAVLREMAQRMRDTVRPHDRVARLAGDEFIVVFEGLSSRADAEAARKHLEASLREPLRSLSELEPDAPSAGGSCGMALFPEDGQTVEELLRLADADMYARKRDQRSLRISPEGEAEPPSRNTV